jgi:hypothetical protein
MRTRKCSNVSHKAEDVISTLEKNNWTKKRKYKTRLIYEYIRKF